MQKYFIIFKTIEKEEECLMVNADNQKQLDSKINDYLEKLKLKEIYIKSYTIYNLYAYEEI